MTQPFDRLPTESNKAFADFVVYLSLGPQRSVDAAALKVGKSPGTLRKWSERHGWVRRAEAYDAFVIEQERELAAVALRAKAVDWAKRQEKLKEAEWEIAEACIAKARELLQRPDVKWTGGDIAKLLDVASKLARLATGMETDRREVTGKDGGPVDYQPMSGKKWSERPAQTRQHWLIFTGGMLCNWKVRSILRGRENEPITHHATFVHDYCRGGKRRHARGGVGEGLAGGNGWD